MAERKRNVIWRYFMAVITNGVNCDVCRKTCGSATNMFKYAAKKNKKKQERELKNR